MTTNLLLHSFATLYGTNKRGQNKQWSAAVYQDESDDKIVYSLIQYGQVGGEMQTTRRQYTHGKNTGRKNETSVVQQCIAETARKWQDKIEKQNYQPRQPPLQPPPQSPRPRPPNDDSETNPGYATAADSFGETRIYPMLALTYTPCKPKRTDIVFPCLAQPKIDGLRCVVYASPADGRIVFQSRTGGVFETMDKIGRILTPLFHANPGLILDGELYTDTIPFEELAGLIKTKAKTRAKPKANTNANENTNTKIPTEQDTTSKLEHVQYRVYDMVVKDMPFVDRWVKLQSLINYSGSTEQSTEWNRRIQLVETVECPDQDTFRALFSRFVHNEGYEGIMLRNRHGLYCQNYRSADLQKYKEFMDHEYPIVGFEEAKGRDSGTVVWTCRTSEGREFHVRPCGTRDQRREWFMNGAAYIGKMLTVEYQELSDKNVPRFPVGKAIRDGY